MLEINTLNIVCIHPQRPVVTQGRRSEFSHIFRYAQLIYYLLCTKNLEQDLRKLLQFLGERMNSPKLTVTLAIACYDNYS